MTRVEADQLLTKIDELRDAVTALEGATPTLTAIALCIRLLGEVTRRFGELVGPDFSELVLPHPRLTPARRPLVGTAAEPPDRPSWYLQCVQAMTELDVMRRTVTDILGGLFLDSAGRVG